MLTALRVDEAPEKFRTPECDLNEYKPNVHAVKFMQRQTQSKNVHFLAGTSV